MATSQAAEQTPPPPALSNATPDPVPHACGIPQCPLLLSEFGQSTYSPPPVVTGGIP